MNVFMNSQRTVCVNAPIVKSSHACPPIVRISLAWLCTVVTGRVLRPVIPQHYPTHGTEHGGRCKFFPKTEYVTSLSPCRTGPPVTDVTGKSTVVRKHLLIFIAASSVQIIPQNYIKNQMQAREAMPGACAILCTKNGYAGGLSTGKQALCCSIDTWRVSNLGYELSGDLNW